MSGFRNKLVVGTCWYLLSLNCVMRVDSVQFGWPYPTNLRNSRIMSGCDIYERFYNLIPHFLNFLCSLEELLYYLKIWFFNLFIFGFTISFVNMSLSHLILAFLRSVGDALGLVLPSFGGSLNSVTIIRAISSSLLPLQMKFYIPKFKLDWSSIIATSAISLLMKLLIVV